MQPGHTRPYQGYPYVNPMVTDAPSITPEMANQWANLPRRPITKGWRNPVLQTGAGGSSSDPSQTVGEARPPSKRDPDQSPVVYIDLPEDSGSDVVENRETQQSTENTFVQDTIMFDQFENRRIDEAKHREDPDSERSSTSSIGLQGSPGPSNRGPFTIYRSPEPQVHQGMRTPPNTLDLNRLPSSRIHMVKNSSNQRTPGLPPFLHNKTNVYGGDPDGCSPIAGMDFPEPPPTYTESEIGGPRSLVDQRLPQTVVELPRTQVITTADPMTPMGLPNHRRKFLTCHHCGRRVHTLVIKEFGITTHIIACIFFLFMVPLVLLVYCTDVFKHKNHYCPNCNKLIGYIRPIIGRKMYFVD